MADNFPYLARQIQGPIAHNFGLGIDHIYEEDATFINWLSQFSIDNLDGEWLDKLGIILGLPRPYTVQKFAENDFEFDIVERLLDGTLHGFSSTADRTQGGLLDDKTEKFIPKTRTPINDELYKRYLHAASLLKRTRSLENISKVLKIFIDSRRYAIGFSTDEGWVNDVIITLSATATNYKECLQVAFDKIFTTSPRIKVDVSLYFDQEYTVPTIENIIKEITGSTTGYTVTYELDEINNQVIFTITLSSSLASYEEEIQTALNDYFEGTSDVVINIVVS